MSDQTGRNLVALLTAALDRDSVLAIQIWRAMEEEEQEDLVFLLIGFLEGQTDLAAELMNANPAEYQNFILKRAGERFAEDEG